jgi:hypothetical protein
MSRAKVFISILMVLILIGLSGASVWAAPGGQGPAPESTEEPTVEPTKEPATNPDDATEEDDEKKDEEEDDDDPTVVAQVLAKFFAKRSLGLSYDEIMNYYESGMGFGVIANACWMSSLLGGDVTVGEILAARKSHDFSKIKLPDGETANNWGQFKKAVLSSDKAKKNLGIIMSKRADKEKKGKGGGKPDTPPGQEKKGKGGGKPDTPPGQEKKGKGGGKPDTPPGQEKEGGGEGTDEE